jgi:hypothetical protein
MSPEEESVAEYVELSPEESEAAQNRHSLLVGQVARASASAEHRMRLLMIGLLDSKYAEVVASGLGMSELIETCKVLVKVNQEISDSQRARITQLLVTLGELMPKRNHLVHGMWAPFEEWRADETPPEPVAFVSKRRSAMREVEISYEAAEQLATDLRRVGSDIFDWTFSAIREAARRTQVMP